MNQVRLLWSCIFAATLGAAPGALLAWAGSKGQGFGLALIGGVIAIGINLSSVWYGTSRSSAVRRILKGVALLLLGKIHGSDQLFSFNEEVVARNGVVVPLEKLQRGLNRGMAVGAIIGGSGALAFGVWFFNDADAMFEQFIGPIIFLGVGLIGGGTWGAAGGLLTVHGNHRRNVILGGLVGTLIGVGIGSALAPMPSKTAAVPLFAIMTAMFATLGVGCGVIAPENFAGRATEEQSPPNEIEARRERLIRSTAARDDAPPEPRFDVRPKPPDVEPQISGGSISGWSVALMALSIFVILIPLFGMLNQQAKQRAKEAQELRTKQQQWQKELEQSIQDGTAGPAIRRLFGVDEKSAPRRGTAPKRNSPQTSTSP